MVENNFSEEHLCGKYLDIYPSMIGSLCPIKSVPDEVFANELLGQGFAIDPFEGKLYAPCDGVIVSIHKAKHAITILNQNNVRLLIHIGIDSVILNGSGFNLHIVESQKVSRSELLATFDLDFIASKAKSIVTPHILIDNQHKIEYLTNLDYTTTNLDFPILRVHISNNHYLKANNLDSINNLNNQTATKNYDLSGLIKSPAINIANKSGIHARPAALLSKFANQLKSINVDDLIIIEKNGQLANLKSMMSVLLLSINYKDTVFIYSSSDEINQLFIAKINDIANTHENQTTIDEINKQQNSTLDKPCQDIQIMETINLSNDVHNNNQHKFYGIFASGGVAVGKLHVLEDDKQILSEAILDNILSNLASYTKTNYEFELNYYNQVLNAVKLDIQNKINNINNIYPNTYDINLNLDRAQSSNVSSDILLDDSHAKLRLELLNAHLNLLLDYDINHDIKELIVKDNKNALFAVVFIYDKYRKSLQNLDNILIKERSNDLYDVLQQLYTKFNNQISISF